VPVGYPSLRCAHHRCGIRVIGVCCACLVATTTALYVDRAQRPKVGLCLARLRLRPPRCTSEMRAPHTV
jgi:hypothetical protein